MHERARTAVVYVLPAAAIVMAWTRLERPEAATARAVALTAVALIPALLRPLWPRLLALAAGVPLVAWLALDTTILHPGRLFSRFGNGVLEYYDVVLPFNPHLHPRMQDAALVGVFLFGLGVAFALARGRTLLAGFFLVVGAGWPGTLLRGGDELVLGGLILVALLAVLVGMRPHAARAVHPALVAGALIVAAAVAATSTSAIAKGELLRWQRWDLYTKADRAVAVSYVWNSDYRGLDWPKKATTVLRIKAPPTPVYWRATTLDAFVDGSWFEDLVPTFPILEHGSEPEPRDALTNDPLLPPGARTGKWVRQEVTVAALEDRHLVGADVPVAYAPRNLGTVSYALGGTALVAPAADRGKTYAVWSYVRRPTPAELARSKPVYPDVISAEGTDLSVGRGISVPPFGTAGREAYVRKVIEARLREFKPLYRQARRIVGRARSPYAAVVGLESWFRDSGRFRYDNHPPAVPGVPALVAFVTHTHRGYCQHFAGAMALMLRFLGIPARVAAGFTSGTYDAGNGTWTVTDHNAHAWVEVWFHGYGWLPFDPTPGRGQLAASYTVSSKSFDAKAAASVLGGAAGALTSLLENRARAQDATRARGEHARSVPIEQPPKHRRAAWILAVLVLAVCGIGLLLYVGKLVRRRSRYLTRDPRRLARACRRELVELLLDQNVEVSRSMTLGELGRTVDSELAVTVDDLVAAAGSARFGAPAAAWSSARDVRSEMREVRRMVRRRLTAWERFSGALSTRSLRVA